MTAPKKILLVNGCSHTAGSEIDTLGVAPHGYSPEKAFGAHLANAMGCDDYVNIAMPGGSNERITRTTIDWIGKYHKPADQLFVVIMWTGRDRFELYDDRNRIWLSLCPGVERSRWFADFTYAVQQYFKFHMLVRTSDVQTYSRLWAEVIMMQSYLKINHINYMFCNAYQGLPETLDYAGFRSQVDLAAYYQPFEDSTGFVQILTQQGFKTRAGDNVHFGEDGHRYWAGVLHAFIQDRGLA